MPPSFFLLNVCVALRLTATTIPVRFIVSSLPNNKLIDEEHRQRRPNDWLFSSPDESRALEPLTSAGGQLLELLKKRFVADSKVEARLALHVPLELFRHSIAQLRIT